MKRKKSRWSFKEDRKMIELARTKSVLQLAKHFGISLASAERRLARLGLSARPNPVARAEAIRQLVELGKKARIKPRNAP